MLTPTLLGRARPFEGNSRESNSSAQLRDALAARHLHLHKRDNMVFVAPPLVIDEADLKAGVNTLAAALDAAWSGAGR